MKAVGVVMSYKRGGGGRQYTQRVLVKLVGVDPRKAGVFIGAKAVYRDRYGNVYKGKVLRLHGKRNGVVEIAFNPNLPGQALGGLVEIVKGE